MGGSTSKMELKIFECIVCMNYLKPPISLCQRGHSICKNCRDKISKCPTCQAPYDKNARNYTLEKLVEEFVAFPCGNKANGCTFEGKIPELEKHEKICKFKNILCPLHIERKCTVTATKEILQKHMETEHVTNYLNNCKNVQLKFALTADNKWNKIIFFDENIFKFNINYKSGTISFDVQQLTSFDENNEVKYEFCINFIDQSKAKKKRTFSVSEYCYHLSLNRTEYLSFSVTQLSPFTDVSNNLVYQFTLQCI